MAKYTSDGNLIQGAARAYKNYDNAPGMYAGLDKVVTAGMDMSKQAMVDKEKADKLAKDELDAEKKKKKDQDNAWYQTAGEAYENAGSFMKDVELKDTIADLDKLQIKWVEAMENGTAAEKAQVQGEYGKIKARIDDHKAFREEVTNPDYPISDAMKRSGVPGGNDGRDLDFLTGLTGEKYEVSTNDKGEKIYSVIGDGSDGAKLFATNLSKKSYTMKQIQDMVIMKDMVPYNEFEEYFTGYAKQGVKERTRASIELAVGKSIPTDFKKLHGYMSDTGFESQQTNMADFLRKDEENIRKEINLTIFDTDTTPGISADEFEAFVQATVDPYHALWQKDGKNDEQAWSDNARRISIERLANATQNEHRLANPETVIPQWKKEGYANKGAYDKAQRGNQKGNTWLGVDLNESVARFDIEGEGATYVKQKDMKNTADTILNIEKKGAGFFKGYDGTTYTHKDGKWSILSYNEETELQESKPYDRVNMLTNLRFSDKPRMLEYLKKVESEKEKKKKTPAKTYQPNPKMAKELQAVGDLKARGRIWVKSLDKYFESNDESTAYEKAVEAIKAKYKTKK